jgi:DNA-binding GntR family transcriptional regulator
MRQNVPMPQPSLRIAGIEPLSLPEARQAVGRLHHYLRECILDGRLPPETTLSQAALAKQLGVSRTPLREVLRMLQEEGLIKSEPNQRMRVAGFDAVELDMTYGSRIVLECLAVAMTIDEFSEQQRRQAKAALITMRKTSKKRDVGSWFRAHTEFHALLNSSAHEPLRTELRSMAERSARYIRVGQEQDPAGWQQAGDLEHEAILDAFVRRESEAAVSLTAHHLERTAIRVLADCAPEYVPKAVPLALIQIHAGRDDFGRSRPALLAGA